MYNHNKAQQSKNRLHISWDILYHNESGMKIFVRVMSHEGYGLSNYQQLNSLFTILFYADNKEDINLWNVITHPCSYLRLPKDVSIRGHYGVHVAVGGHQCLTYWGQDKMDAIFQTFSNQFS